MLFWILWAIVVLALACLFVASLKACLVQRKHAGLARPRVRWGDGKIIAMEAQFFLAPRLAEAELRDLLARRYGRIGAPHEFRDAVSFSRALNELQGTQGTTGRSH